MSIYDLAIIGGGISGVSIARELSRYKLRIALLEKEEELAFGVSKSNSGIIHAGTQNPPNSLRGALCVQGNKLIRKICQELGTDFRETGALVVAFSQKDLLCLLQLRKKGQVLGVPGLKIVNHRWLIKNEPNLSPEASAALFCPTAGILSPYRLVYDLSENAVKNGVEIYTRARVERIAYLEKASLKNNRSFEITTSRGIFKTRYLVNAAGLFADEVSNMLGVNYFRITPRKGQEFILDKKREHLTNHLIFPLPSENSKGVLVIKTSDGNPMIGPTAEDISDKEDLSTTEDGLKEVVASARKLVPSISGGDIIAYFAGLRPVAGDDFIIRHEDSVAGFINVAGIQSPGLTAAPAIAVMVSNILKKKGLALKNKLSFKARRKKSTHLFNISLSQAEKLIRNNPRYGDIVCRCEMVSAGEIKDALDRGAKTLDGIKFRTRAQAGRCHGSFCTTRIMKIIFEETRKPLTEITKNGKGSEIVTQDKAYV